MPASSRSAHLDKVTTESARRFVARLAILALVVSAGAATYTVERGDTLSEIAAEHGVSLRELVDVNAIDNPDLIRPGLELKIPGIDVATTVVYTVQRGDTLAKIAKEHGATVSGIVAANGIENPNRIYPGTALTISGQTAAPPSGTGAPDAEPSISTTLHVVSAGETLAKIAALHGVNLRAIIAENNLANPNLIRIGQQLRIPASFICPVADAIFINDWGFPRSGGRFHEGTDLFAPRGTPVVAPVPGFVEQVDGPRGGLQFELTGVDGTTYYGTHLDAFGLAGNVRSGDVIGYVGNTGNAITTPPHLHFEMHPPNSAAVNPYQTLKQACG